MSSPTRAAPPAPDPERRFGGLNRLYGPHALPRFAAAHVAVVGIGGVGSWAVEALARSGIGRLTLVDLDMIAESNVNRQLHAVDEAFGLAKVSAMAARVRAINPACEVREIEDFITPDNCEAFLAGGFDAVIDAADDNRAKVALIVGCRRRGVPIVTAGAAGGRTDPCSVRVDDLARTTQDALLARVRSRLRKDFGFPKTPQKKFGVTAVYSLEPMRRPLDEAGLSCAPAAGSALACAGYGSSVCVTAPFGFAAAGAVLRELVRPATTPEPSPGSAPADGALDVAEEA